MSQHNFEFNYRGLFVVQPQEILNNLPEAIRQRWGKIELCPNSEQIQALAASIKELKPEIKRLKQQKRECSSRFSDSAISVQQKKQLKIKVGGISNQIKQLETSLKKNLSSLATFFQTDEEPTELPKHFLNHTVNANAAKVHRLELVGESMAEHWDNYVAKHQQATIYHAYAWKNTLQQAHAIKGIYVAAFDINDSIIGVLPAFELDSRLFGKYIISIPYFNYGGPIAESPDIESRLLDYAASLSKQRRAQHFEARCMRQVNNWPTKQDKVSMLLRLPTSDALLDKQLGSKLRSQVKQASQHDLKAVFGNIELLDDFYQVFSENMRDLGTPVYSKRFFRVVLGALPKSSTLVVVYSNRKPLASGFLLSFKDTLEIPWAASLRSYNKYNTNMYMYRQILSYAISRQFRWFDFGRSTINAPTYRFKSQWGAEPVQHYWHYWLADGGAMPELNPSNVKYRLAIRAWQKMPVWLTKIVGPRIVAYLP